MYIRKHMSRLTARNEPQFDPIPLIYNDFVIFSSNSVPFLWLLGLVRYKTVRPSYSNPSGGRLRNNLRIWIFYTDQSSNWFYFNHRTQWCCAYGFQMYKHIYFNDLYGNIIVLCTSRTSTAYNCVQMIRPIRTRDVNTVPHYQ